jgi:hypothetical protein
MSEKRNSFKKNQGKCMYKIPENRNESRLNFKIFHRFIKSFSNNEL